MTARLAVVPRPLDGEMPQNLEAEQAVLGACFIDPRCIDRLRPIISPQDFYLPDNGEIFATMCRLNDAGAPTDMVLVYEELRDRCGGSAYGAALANLAISSVNAEWYAAVIRKHAKRRRLIDAGTRIQAGAYGDDDPGAVAAAGLEALEEAAGKPLADDGLRSLHEIATLAYPRLDRIDVAGVTTGLRVLDELITRLTPGALWIIGARTSVGKTSLALTVLYHVAVELGLPVAMFSLEMSREEIYHRLLMMDAHIPSTTFNRRSFSEDEYRRASESTGKLAACSITIDDTAGLSIVEMRRRTRLQHQAEPLSLVIADYVQLFTVDGRRENRSQEVATVVRELKAVAQELQVPVLAPAQVNRQPEGREVKLPELHDLKDSGEIEQSADGVMIVHRRSAYDRDMRDGRGLTDVVVAKHRGGPQGKLRLWFEETEMRFRDVRYGEEGRN